jgi:hypothetical protein
MQFDEGQNEEFICDIEKTTTKGKGWLIEKMV